MEWHLWKPGSDQLVCKFAHKDRGEKWLRDQIDSFPNGYFKDCYLAQYPPDEPEQLTLF